MSASLTSKLSPSSEVILSTTLNRASVHRDEKKGLLRRIAPKLYTSNLKEDPEQVIWRNRWAICSLFFPNGLISDRTALESKPASDGSIFLIADRSSDLILPGISFHPRRGAGPIDGFDMPFMHTLRMSCQARALLENRRSSRARSHISRTLSREELELWLDGILRKGGGDDALNKLRSQTKELADPLDMAKEAAELDGIIGALLGTREVVLVSDVGKARSRGLGYDTERLESFDELRSDLARHPFQDCPDRSNQSFLPFFESYFSNFIEGTEFLVDEAYNIVYNGITPQERPEDAHDILGTFQVVSNSSEMNRAPKSSEEFIKTLCDRHSIALMGRPSARPGHFKRTQNRAGESVFVHPDLVKGTLIHGFEMLNSLEHPMARGAFAMFLVAEVHPFADGNGRLARIMMNSELTSKGQERVIIPSVFRTEYIQSLKALTHNKRSEGLIKVLSYAQTYVSQIDFSDYANAERQLAVTNAFQSPADALGDGAKLRLPESLAH